MGRPVQRFVRGAYHFARPDVSSGATQAGYYHAREGVYPVIYTSTSWWSQCVGTVGDFSSTKPLWVARYSSSAGSLPLQLGLRHVLAERRLRHVPGRDQDQFNGSLDQLEAIANG